VADSALPGYPQTYTWSMHRSIRCCRHIV